MVLKCESEKSLYVNIAGLGIPSQESIGWGGVPERAIDGNADGIYDQ